MKTGIVFCFLICFAFACSKSSKTDPIKPVEADSLAVAYDFPKTFYNFSNNPITDDGIYLGKTLFFDGNISRDGTISCAECHNQAYAFTHHGHALSHGIDGLVGTRNAPTLVNLAYQPFFFWDGGTQSLDLFSVAPITNPVEMDQNMTVLLQKLQHNSQYVALFKKAFGTEEITTDRFLKAISQFLLQMESKNSKYDQYVSGKTAFTDDEKEGLRLFNSKGCNTCHKPPLFTDFSFRSNGLDTTFLPNYVDHGRSRITEKSSDDYKFKVPTLRNIAFTYPYMHDGRFQALEDVLVHYASNMVNNRNLDASFKKSNSIGIPMTVDEQKKIILFLKTLTDTEFLNNKKFFP